jgi:hypothetical protein
VAENQLLFFDVRRRIAEAMRGLPGDDETLRAATSALVGLGVAMRETIDTTLVTAEWLREIADTMDGGKGTEN